MADFRFSPLCGTPLEPVAEGEDAGRPACPTGHFTHYDNPAVTAYAFVRDDQGRYLVLRRAKEPCLGEWDLPGGFVEAGETPAQAIARELREETGLEIEIERILGAFTGQYGAGGKWTIDVGFVARAAGGDFRLDAEKSAAAWLPLDQLPRLAFAGERDGLAELRRK
ncbi:MAG TPA: NUDIX hydrolase [Capillimicrobium sp.]|jgi:mutator protein MutT